MTTPPRLKINEIFHSIQGEGTRAGLPCVFIRLTGCHLRCTYCDTEYAFYDGRWMSLDEILSQVRAYHCPTVEVTGGEPLLQPDVYPLLDRLLAEFPTVLLETSGAVSIARVDPRVVRIVDLKCPASGESHRNDWSNIDLLTPNDEVKFVIGNRADYEWSRDVVTRHDLTRRCPVLFSPTFEIETAPDAAHNSAEPPVAGATPPPTPSEKLPTRLAPLDLATWILADRLDVRLGLQLHKLIWSPSTRGV